MSEMKKVGAEMGGVMGLIAKKWPHIKEMKIVDDGSKYGSANQKDLVRNEILGVVPAGDCLLYTSHATDHSSKRSQPPQYTSSRPPETRWTAS